MSRDLAEKITLPRKAKLAFRTPLFLVKLFNYEYWPVGILFFPAIMYYLFLALKARSLTYFTATNPGIELGGFFGESKSAILKSIPDTYLPVTLYFDENVNLSIVVTEMQLKELSFPVICKPDKGERGYLVEKIIDEKALIKYLSSFSGKLIIQEFITYEIELGVLYYRFPNGNGSGISSIVIKEFLSVTGDGCSSIEQLMWRSARARFQLQSLRKKMGEKLDEILAAGETFLIEPIGNHSRGTRFLNGKKLISPQLVKVFDEIAAKMNEFYFGRFDLKVNSYEDFVRGSKIKIMEVNGTTSEPGHIYGSDMNLIKVWKDILYNTRLIYEIAIQNNKRGVTYVPFREVIKTVYYHFK